jgi:hypothetical protein
VDRAAAVLWTVQESVVTTAGERVALVVVLVACVLAEQAGVNAPVLTAHAAAQTNLTGEPEGVDDRGAFHELDEQSVGQPLERVGDLVLTDADVRGLHELAVILDVGVLDVDLA